MTTPSLLPPLTPTAECVNNKIAFSADEWRENAIKEKKKTGEQFGAIYIKCHPIYHIGRRSIAADTSQIVGIVGICDATERP